MMRSMMDDLTMTIACESPDEHRALYRALLQSVNTHRNEVERMRRLYGSGYGSESDRAMMDREVLMVTMLDRLATEVLFAMRESKVEPW